MKDKLLSLGWTQADQLLYKIAEGNEEGFINMHTDKPFGPVTKGNTLIYYAGKFWEYAGVKVTKS